MKPGDHLDDIARAVSFLSRLPIPSRHFRDYDGSLARAAGMFPMAGLVIGLCPGLLVLGLWLTGANAALTALVSLIALTVITGALHEDGLADATDAFGARGGRDHRLEIMKDSRIGVYGVLALVSIFALRAAALTIILSVSGGWNALLVLVAIAALSRTAMVWHWRRLPSARTGGIADSAGAPQSGAARLAYAWGCGVFAVLATMSLGPLSALIALAMVAAATMQWTSMVDRQLGGHTGDTLGATQQIAETACLVTLALLL